MENMSVEDLLEALAKWGSVSVSRSRFPSAGSPHLKGQPVLWKVTITIPGYAETGAAKPSFCAEDKSMRQACEAVYQEVERFLYSDAGREARKSYVDRVETHNAYAARVNPGDLPGVSSKPRNMGKPLPDVIEPSTPGIDTEVYL